MSRYKNIFHYVGLAGFLLGIGLTVICWINDKDYGYVTKVLVSGSYGFGLMATFSVYLKSKHTVKKQDLGKKEGEENANAEAQDLVDYSSITKKMEEIYVSSANNKAKSDQMLRVLCNGLNASQGALYRSLDHDHKIRLELYSSYAFIPNQTEETLAFDADTDLVGLAVKEDRKIELNDIPRENFKVFSGLGKTSTASVMIIPVKSDQEMKGAIELSFFSKQDKGIQRFLHDNMSKIGSLL